MDDQNSQFFKKTYESYSELGSKYEHKINQLIDEMLVDAIEINDKLTHFRDEMKKYGELDSKYEKPYLKYVIKMSPYFVYFKYFVEMAHLTDKMFDFKPNPSKKIRHIRNEMSAAKIEMNNKLLQLHGEMEKYDESYCEKAYVEYAAKMNYLPDEMIDTYFELHDELLELNGKMLDAEIEMNDKLRQLHRKLSSCSKYEKAYAEYVTKMNHLTDETITAEFELHNKLFHLRDKIFAAELELNNKLRQLQGEENDNE